MKCIGISCLPFGLTLECALKHLFSVVQASLEDTYSHDPSFEHFVITGVTVFDLFFEFVIEVCLEMVTKGGIIKDGGSVTKKAIQAQEFLRPVPKGFM
jgi:hypothetical protein